MAMQGTMMKVFTHCRAALHEALEIPSDADNDAVKDAVRIAADDDTHAMWELFRPKGGVSAQEAVQRLAARRADLARDAAAAAPVPPRGAAEAGAPLSDTGARGNNAPPAVQPPAAKAAAPAAVPGMERSKARARAPQQRASWRVQS